jgi:large subunit ribosomal protein L16
MVLTPKRTKYRKMQKGHMSGLTKAAQFVDFGEFGMQALSRGRLTQQQIEACRVAVNRHFNRRGKVWIRVFPDKSVSKKPAETRMGKGKGAHDLWEAVIRPGRILFEVSNVPEELAQEALRRAAAKLPIRTRFVKRVERV